MTTVRLLSHSDLRAWTAHLFKAMGVPPEHAALVADALVAANLRGVDSHGVHLADYYAEHIRRGLMLPSEKGSVVRESGGCLVYDGGRGLGQVAAAACCDHALRLAGEHGLGLVVNRNSNHFGAAAYWGQRISSAGKIGIVMCNASPSVPPWQGKEGRIGTNPICVSVPSSGRGAWLLDMATTTVALNKILRARANQQPQIPAGWAMDADGAPTTETEKAKLIMPLGGYKGSGLGLFAEIFCGVLGGGALAPEVGGTYRYDRPMGTSHMFLAIDVTRFLPGDEFEQRMEALVAWIKNTPTAAGYDEVLVAGEPEERIEAERRQSGIPIDAGTWSRFEALAAEFGVPLP